MTVIAGVDIETTDLKQEDGHRIIEICLGFYELENRRRIRYWTQRINPQRSISAGAQKVHGISISDLEGCPVWEDVAPTVLKAMSYPKMIVAHNAEFDIPFIALELMRIGLEPPNMSVFCTKENGRWATPDGKYPRLKELCFACGVEYDDDKAHAADYDVGVMMDCFFEGVDRGVFHPTLLDSPEVAA